MFKSPGKPKEIQPNRGQMWSLLEVDTHKPGAGSNQDMQSSIDSTPSVPNSVVKSKDCQETYRKMYKCAEDSAVKKTTLQHIQC